MSKRDESLWIEDSNRTRISELNTTMNYFTLEQNIKDNLLGMFMSLLKLVKNLFLVVKVDNSVIDELQFSDKVIYFAFGVDSNWEFTQIKRHTFEYGIREALGNKDINRCYGAGQTCQKYSFNTKSIKIVYHFLASYIA